MGQVVKVRYAVSRRNAGVQQATKIVRLRIGRRGEPRIAGIRQSTLRE